MRRLFALVAAALFLLFLAPVARAQESSMIGEYDEELSAFLDSLPKELRSRYQDILNDSEGMNRVLEEASYQTVFDEAVDALEQVFPSVLSLFVRVFGLVLCAGLFTMGRNTLDGSGVSESFRFCTALCFCIPLLESTAFLLNGCTGFLTSVSNITAGLVPVVCAVTAATGHITAAAVSRAALMLVFSVIQNLSSVFLVPVVHASFAAGIVSVISDFVHLDGISRFLRKGITVLISFVVTVIGFLIGVQTALAKGADTFSIRTVKFALGNAVPLVGTALADAMSTVTGSLSLIRSVAGGLAAFSVVLLLLPILIELLLYRLVLGLCQGAAEMVGCQRESVLISEVNATVGFMLAIVAIASVLLLFVLALFALVGGNL